MKSRIAVKSGKCAFQIDQFQGRPSPKNALALASKNRRRFASLAICLPKSLEAARLLRTVRTSRLGRQSASSSGNAVSRLSFTVTSGDEAGCGAATDKASVSAILATCLGSQKHSGGSGCGSWSNVLRWARIRQAFLVSRQPSVLLTWKVLFFEQDCQTGQDCRARNRFVLRNRPSLPVGCGRQAALYY